MTLTFEQLQTRKKPREITHVINTDDDAVKALAIADESLKQAKVFGTADERAAAQATYDDAEKAVREAALILRLRALPRDGDGSFAVLKAEHPPTAEDNRRVAEASGDTKAKAAWHSATFYPALVAACLIDPEVTIDQAAELARTWNDAEWTGLRDAALAVNQEKTNTGGLVFS